ncbi:conserved unknown protein [Ectocarpus siliculosus]|uniref:Uncharacterized protein n=1 Tax=Ectocarpus siliculosus TaxID=2880 RepID=D8LAY1_ECTSI|nr:conserved unknown protein [Ectocarpus siliculosus]|eukprot:CBN76490.1 conserved unknown protein [Ectocarpus siliculosus]
MMGVPPHMNVGPGSMGGAGGAPREGGGAGGAGGGGGQGSSKRPRVSSASGNGNMPGGSGADGGGSSPAGSAAVGNGNSNGGSGGGGGSSTRGGGGGGGRSGTPSQQMEEAPPMPPALNTGMSQMIVTRPGTGGEGAPRRGLGDRGPSFGFGAMPSFAEAGGPGGGVPGGAAPSAVRLAHERSLPTGVTDPAEVSVYFILAKGYLSHELGMLGFPAYDRSQLLLGFYKEVQSTAGQTQVVFIPAQRIPNLDDRDTAATTEILREEMRKGSQSIISYENCNGSLPKMREDAFMYYWSKSMIIDMESNEAPEQQGSV